YLHQFKLYDSNEGLYHDCDGIGLVLKEKSNGVEIIDESNNKLTFNSNGCITDIVAGINGDVHKVFSYDGDKLVRIFDARSQYNNEDGYNESLLFTYTEQGNIDEVKACKGSSCIKTTKFVYSGNTLIGLETKVGTSVIQRYGLSYDEKELLKAVTEINGINVILINYDDDCRVKEIQYAKQCYAGAYVPHYKVVDTLRFDYNMIGETEWVLSTVVTNKNNVSIIYYLNRKNKIISSFEAVKNAEGQIIGLKDLSVGSTKTLAGAGGSVLFNEEPCALGSYGQYIYDVPDEFILWRDDTEKANKYYGCSFYLKHKEICERLKLTAKYKFALNGETCQEQTASVFVDGTACDAWQKVGIVLSLPEVEDEKDVVTLEELKINIVNLDNFIVQQIELSPLNFAPTAKSDLLVSAGDGQIYFTQINKITLTKADNSDTIIIENNKDTYHYFTEQDLLRTVLNKMRNSYAVNDVECFDVICNNGKKRISKVKELTFTVNGADNLAYALPLTFTNKFVSQNGYNVTEQRTIFGADGIILEKAVSAVNNHSSSSQSRVNYFGQTLSETDEYGVTKEYTYDGSGNLVQSVLLGRNAYGEREGRMVCAVSTYDEDGYLESESDGINTIVYEYNKPFNVIAKESLTIGGIVHEKLYEYNLVGRLLSVTLKVNGAVKARNEITYDKGLVRTVTDGYVKYGIIHDHEGNSATYTVFNGEEEVPVQIQTEVFDEESATTKIETRYIKDGMSEDVVSAVYDLYGRMHGLHYGSLEGNSLSESNDVTYTYANLGGASQLAQPLLT
ncbi:MAG: hypothetical protein IJC01_03280, partial [Clostridia bacterium]|nr:hypothetical protein [Clostridia bacterium]